MSTADPVAVRAIALAEAVKYLGGKGDPIAVAESFLAFLNGTESQPAATTTTTKAATTTKSPKVETPKSPKVETPKGPTKEEVGKKVEALLRANLRPAAVELLKTYGENVVSASTLPVEHYADFLAKADALLMTA